MFERFRHMINLMLAIAWGMSASDGRNGLMRNNIHTAHNYDLPEYEVTDLFWLSSYCQIYVDHNGGTRHLDLYLWPRNTLLLSHNC